MTYIHKHLRGVLYGMTIWQFFNTNIGYVPMYVLLETMCWIREMVVLLTDILVAIHVLPTAVEPIHN